MNGCFLNMNDIDIGRVNPLEKHISDIIIILNKYFYSDTNLMLELANIIKNATGGDSVEITHSFTTKFAMSVKISKGLKRTIKKQEKKKGVSEDTMFGVYFTQLLEGPIHDFLLSIVDRFREAVNVEYDARDVSSTYAAEVMEGFLYLVQMPMSVRVLTHVISLLERDNYIIIEFL